MLPCWSALPPGLSKSLHLMPQQRPYPRQPPSPSPLNRHTPPMQVVPLRPVPQGTGPPLVLDTVKLAEPLLEATGSAPLAASAAPACDGSGSSAQGAAVGNSNSHANAGVKEGEQTLVLRLYEPHGCRGQVRVLSYALG